MLQASFWIGPCFAHAVKVDPAFDQLYCDDSPVVGHVLRDVPGVGGAGHDVVLVVVLVVVLHLCGEPGVGVGVALDLDAADAIWQDHDDVRAGTAGDLLFEETDLAVVFFQVIE